jgi:hypothetical protein
MEQPPASDVYGTKIRAGGPAFYRSFANTGVKGHDTPIAARSSLNANATG